MIYDRPPGLYLYNVYITVQHLMTAGWDLDDLEDLSVDDPSDLSDVWKVYSGTSSDKSRERTERVPTLHFPRKRWMATHCQRDCQPAVARTHIFQLSFFHFFVPFMIFFICLSLLLIIVVTQIRGHIAAPPPIYCIRVCVLRIKPFFLPVDIRHNQCPYRFLNPREIRVMC